MRALFLLVLLASTYGCRGLPQRGVLPETYHLRVGQLEFHSDFELPDDHRLVRELIAEREELSSTLGLIPSHELIDVYLFRDAEAYRTFLNRYFPKVPSRRAFFLETDTRLAVYAHWNDRVAEDLRHEVAHGYLHAMIPDIPLWLDEGLAEFFEVPRNLYGLNRPHLELLSDMRRLDNWQPNLRQLEQLTDAGQMGQHHYAEAWAWVYFLLHSEPERRALLTDYLAELRSEGVAEPVSLRLAATGAQPEHVLGQYLASLHQNGALIR